MKKEYLIIGSNNFWYAMCHTKKEALEQAKEIMETESEDCESSTYSDDESGHRPLKPDVLYIYEAKEIKRV